MLVWIYNHLHHPNLDLCDLIPVSSTLTLSDPPPSSQIHLHHLRCWESRFRLILLPKLKLLVEEPSVMLVLPPVVAIALFQAT